MLRFAITLLFASSCFAQHFTSTFSGWGSVASPGTGFPPGTRRPAVTPFSGSYRNGHGNGFGYGYGGIVAYPSFYNGYPSDFSNYGDPGNTAAPPVPSVAAPPVIINQYFSAPPVPAGPAPDADDQSVHIYSPQSGAAGAQTDPQYAEPRSYLIAYKDHSVYSALAYWVEDNTLHYVTTSNTHNQADLSLIDLDFTKKLNQDRNMPFTLNR